jgi:hypothetical protein
MDLKEDSDLLLKWKQLIDEGTMDKIILALEAYRGNYRPEVKDPESHMQQEYNGGSKAWDMVSCLLRTLPHRVAAKAKPEQVDKFVRSLDMPDPRKAVRFNNA